MTRKISFVFPEKAADKFHDARQTARGERRNQRQIIRDRAQQRTRMRGANRSNTARYKNQCKNSHLNHSFCRGVYPPYRDMSRYLVAIEKILYAAEGDKSKSDRRLTDRLIFFLTRQIFSLATATSFSKAAASFTASSAIIFLSTATPALVKPQINLL